MLSRRKLFSFLGAIPFIGILPKAKAETDKISYLVKVSDIDPDVQFDHPNNIFYCVIQSEIGNIFNKFEKSKKIISILNEITIIHFAEGCAVGIRPYFYRVYIKNRNKVFHFICNQNQDVFQELNKENHIFDGENVYVHCLGVWCFNENEFKDQTI